MLYMYIQKKHDRSGICLHIHTAYDTNNGSAHGHSTNICQCSKARDIFKIQNILHSLVADFSRIDPWLHYIPLGCKSDTTY